MRKLFSLFVALFITSILWAYDFKSDDLYYNITSNQSPYTVEVTYQEYWWSSSNYSGLTIATIPETVNHGGITYSVTGIGNEAFWYCNSLISITIPNSVTSIGDNAFSNCSSLTSIIIPGSVMSIGDDAFSYCHSINTLIIPNSVMSIGDNAFSSCSSLTSITLGNSVTSIGNNAFSNCSSLAFMAVESDNTTYDSREDCNAIVETVTNTLIAGCKNTIIPNSVTTIGDNAFYICRSLTSITIPNSVTCIGSGAFYDCSKLSSITIPNSVTSIRDYAFSACRSLTSMIVEGGNTTYDSREDCNAIIETATNTLIAGCQNTIILNSITNIGNWAFEGCSYLTSVSIPNSVISIGERAFSGCSSLNSIAIPSSVMSIGDYAFGYSAFPIIVICKALEIPNLGTDIFSFRSLTESTLYVPSESLSDYKLADQWKDFGAILSLDELPAAFDNTRVTSNPTQKLLHNGQLLILRDGKTYNTIGQEL